MYFAKTLRENLEENVPIGLIQMAAGGAYLSELLPGELCEQFALSCIYWYIAATGYYVGCIAFDVTAFAHQCNGFVACIECYVDYFGAFGYEYALSRFVLLAQLSFGEGAENLHTGVLQ
jgi:hypothetical protein